MVDSQWRFVGFFRNRKVLNRICGFDFEKTCKRMEVVVMNDDAVGFFSNQRIEDS